MRSQIGHSKGSDLSREFNVQHRRVELRRRSGYITRRALMKWLIGGQWRAPEPAGYVGAQGFVLGSHSCATNANNKLDLEANGAAPIFRFEL